MRKYFIRIRVQEYPWFDFHWIGIIYFNEAYTCSCALDVRIMSRWSKHGAVASMRTTRDDHPQSFFSNVSVVADSVAPALSRSVETLAVIMTGPCPATNDLIYLKSLMWGWLFKSEMHLWNSWDNNGNTGVNHGLPNTIVRINFFMIIVFIILIITIRTIVDNTYNVGLAL